MKPLPQLTSSWAGYRPWYLRKYVNRLHKWGWSNKDCERYAHDLAILTEDWLNGFQFTGETLLINR